LFFLTNYKQKIKEKAKQGITFHKQSVSHFVVMCGKADYSSLPKEDREHMLSLDEFIELAKPHTFDEKFRQFLERDNRI
jgi:hypothetical protein